MALLLWTAPFRDAAPAAQTPAAASAGSTARERGAGTAAEPRAASRESVRGLLELARRQSDAGNTRAALATLGKARAAAPNAEDVLRAYAEASFAVEGPLAALPAMEALTRLHPDVGQYQYLHGLAILRAGDAEAAVERLRNAERLEPDEPEILTTLGLALNARARYADALAPLRRSLSFAPDDVATLAALAEAEAELGQLSEAQAHAERALARSGSDAAASRSLGILRLKQQRPAEARDALLRALASDAASAKAEQQLSLAYAALGDEANAAEHRTRFGQRHAEAEARILEVRGVTGFVAEEGRP
jgi:tetratricopeptide (TPR) repeat protein